MQREPDLSAQTGSNMIRVDVVSSATRLPAQAVAVGRDIVPPNHSPITPSPQGLGRWK